MRKLSLLSASVFSLFLASCGGRGGGRSADTDSDGIFDSKDSCRNSSTGFISTPETDYDGDGCKDSTEDVDDDGDGLIELHNATELNNIRHDLDGTHYDDRTSNEGSNAGCPTTNPVGCIGYELADDIDLATDPATSDWVPIAGNFIATLEGNGHSINNLTIDRDSLSVGLFEVLATEGIVQNLSFVGGSVVSRSNSSNSLVGVLVGKSFGTISDVSVGLSVSIRMVIDFGTVGGLVGVNADGGTIQGSFATGKADGGGGSREAVGGLVGVNEGTIQGSFATGKTDGGDGNRDAVGGLVGVNAGGGIIQGSFATGKADGGDGNADYVGGLLGYNGESTIVNSYATGNVSDDAGDGDFVGGLAGYNGSGSTIQGSYATGKVAGGDGNTDIVGGLVSYNFQSNIEDSYATGDADGNNGNTDVVGGLVGSNIGSIIQNSYATGKVAGGDGNGDVVGGLVGGHYKSGTIQNSYATGKADGGNGDDDRVGGLVGNLYGTIKNSYATGKAAGGNGDGDHVGGLVGYVYFGILQKNYSLSDVDGGAGNDNVGRLVGSREDSTMTASDSYYSNQSAFNNSGTVLDLGISKTNDELKSLVDSNTGWDTKNWNFGSTSQYPSLKSYKENSIGTQIAGDLLCGQKPTDDFVQCPTPAPTP